MWPSALCRPFATMSLLLGAWLTPGTATANGPYYLGPKTCQECHKAEYEVWEKTKHSLSFKEIHKAPKAAEILAAVGGDKNMRKNATCVQCHFTLEQADASATAIAKSAVSCESCHGAASDWVKIHNDYGGPDITKEKETLDHKAKRIEDSRNAGQLRPEMKYDLVANCLSCHGLARASVGGDSLAKMLEAGHPISEFELVRYSQGSVRHRFYPPDMTVNAEMTSAELARLFVTGQAAKLVSATQALAKSDNAVYKELQQKRVAEATAALSALKSLPEAATLIAAPTEENARKLVGALVEKDVFEEVKTLLPGKDIYK